MTMTEERIEARTTTSEPTAFGRVVLGMMRERRIADASELGLERLDLRALRRHCDGENAYHRRQMPTLVAEALEATEPEKGRMGYAYLYRRPVNQPTNA